jgi:methylated-DNA-[protein]-cysteine S-methyltransferase
VRFAIVTTELGDLGLVDSELGLRALVLPRPALREYLQTRFAGAAEDITRLAELAGRLQEYARGLPVAFNDVKLDVAGTPFQMAVWQATRAIPRGQTRTYGELARMLGRPGAARAVGAAEAANPVPIVVPCHRVIGSDGRLCGFGGGLPLKQRLLALERGQVSLNVNIPPPTSTGTPRPTMPL